MPNPPAVIWQDPPEDARGSASVYEPNREFAHLLHAHPGRWALYRADASTASVGTSPAKKYGLQKSVRIHRDKAGNLVRGRWDIYMRAPEQPKKGRTR